MSLTDDQIEALMKCIGTDLRFDDFDSVLRRCYGEARIHAIGTERDPGWELARACIKLVEREGYTVVFLQYVLASPRCSTKTRQEAIAIFPELRTIGRPFAEIVSFAADGLATHAEQIAKKVEGGAALESLVASIADLNCYKNLHEAIHQIQINARPEVPADDDAGDQKEFRRALRQYMALLRTAQIKADEALNNLPAGAAQRMTEHHWIAMLGECAIKIQAAIDQADTAGAELALDVSARTVGPLPDRINRRIFEIARGLPLDKVLDALRAARAQGPSASLDGAVEAIGALRLAVLTRVLEHSRWQEADNGLFALDQVFNLAATAAFRKFARQWPMIRRQIHTVIDGDSGGGWAVMIRGYADEVDHALEDVEQDMGKAPAELGEAAFNDVMFEKYDALRQETRMRFFAIDSALKLSCLELLRIRAPLEAIMTKVQP